LRNSCLRVPRVHDFTSSFACLFAAIHRVLPILFWQTTSVALPIN
jgi:hypothetical protein